MTEGREETQGGVQGPQAQVREAERAWRGSLAGGDTGERLRRWRALETARGRLEAHRSGQERAGRQGEAGT